MKNLFSILIITFLTFIPSSCSYINVNLLTNGELKRKNFVESIPFELRKDLIVVKAFINSDSTEREFIFDTGAFNSKIESELANSLKMETVTTKSNKTAAGISRDIEVTKIDSIRLGNTNFYNIGAGKVVYDKESYSPCIAKDGIIGANLMKLAHWTIDFEKKQIHFSDTPFSESHNRASYKIPFDKPVLSGTPKIDITIEGKTVENVLFDVGYNGGLVLPFKFANTFSSDKEEIIYDHSTSGIYGSNVDTLIVKELSVSIGSYKNKIPVEFSSIGKALLGNEILKNSIVLIDYEEKEIILQPFQDLKITSSKKFIPGILNDSLWVVNRTTNDIPLKLGDTLKHINNLQPKDIFSNHCDYFWSIEKVLNSKNIVAQKSNGQKVSFHTSVNK